MAENPFISLTPAIRLRPSSGLRTPSRSPPRCPSRSRSRSPDRNLSSFICASDPLLANLSPESTLTALSATDVVRTTGKTAQGILSKAIADASTAERSLAVRAAVAGQNLKQWYTEVLSWEWPQKRDASLGKGFVSSKREDACTDGQWDTSLGCLPAAVVEQHEYRIDEIKADMEMLDVEELKEHVLNAHIPSRSRPSSSNSTLSTNMHTLSYVQLSDFTAVITATILQALPYLSKLNALLNIWEIRLAVLHQIPELLAGLGSTKRAIDGALDRLGTGLLPEIDDPFFSKTFFDSARHKLKNMVLIVGSKMDRILDSLEGQDDALPDAWIDEMEAIEAGFATWAFEAEKMAVENDFGRSSTPLLESFMQSSEIEKPDEAGCGPSTQNTESLQFQKCREEMEDSSRIVSDLPGTNVKPEPPKTPSRSDLDLNDVLTPASINISLSQPPPIPRIKEQDKDKPKISVQESPKEAKTEGEPNSLPSNSDTSTLPSSPLSCTPETSSIHEEITSPPSSTGPDPLTSRQTPSIDDPQDPSGQSHGKQATNVLPGASASITSEKPSSNHEESPVPQENSNTNPPGNNSPGTTINDGISLPGSSPLAVPSRPASPQSPLRSTTSPHLAIPCSAINRSTPSSPTTADISPHGFIKSKQDTLKLDTGSHRRDSTISIASTAGSGFSYGSNPEIRDAQVATSHGSPIVVESPGGFLTNGSKSPGTHGHNINTVACVKKPKSSDHLASASRSTLYRTMSLPLERFMDGDSQVTYGTDDLKEQPQSSEFRQASSAAIEVLPKAELRSIVVSNRLSIGPANGQKSMPNLRRTVSSLGLSSLHRLSTRSLRLSPNYPWGSRVSTSSESLPSTAEEPSPSISVTDSKVNAIKYPTTPTPPPSLPRRSSKRLSKLLSPVASLSSQKQKKIIAPLHSAPLSKSISANSSTAPSITTPRSPEDHLEEKISSILTTIPARIHLASTPESTKSNQSTPRASDCSYSNSPKRDFLQSQSPALSRSNTPTPSLTLTPAFGRSRRPHTHNDDDSAVRLYHLHRGGKTAPVKLFVRSVGEDGERVMVRVGGGWADLGEYLREYALHHGRRDVSDGKFEVRGIPTHNTSPNHSLHGKHAAPTSNTSPSTPISRPGSAFDIRPTSLNVRKSRRSMATPSGLPTLTTANIEKASQGSNSGSGGSHFSFLSSARRRLSTSSNASMSLASGYGGDGSHVSTPLGLAGPKPKSRQVSISPENEAWVEDVIGRARRTSATLRPERSYGNLRRFRPAVSQVDVVGDLVEGGHRRVSNTGDDGGGNKRVYLRGLGKGRE
ncbi:GAS2 domain-containing protein [Paracoccidioides lutzii Pb01]|uniref:GAS2 domain-containing protein n=1 Tax=Paracoccidioides lutzii (strain ATCC MYA-826 / Pb01) TaxID=502779 RepID=C1H1E3_PARBA|nr:GAS2 domain-containing protein [Paracoccidioides lutzii Pb01]EEH33537.1 GAS2 domain-containing protein [Paracoccidioides lutzii Pb01]